MKTENASTAAHTNPKHEIFIQGILYHGDKVRAYKTAYGEDVKDESARVSASNLLKNPEIKSTLEGSWKQIFLSVEEDKAAFIHQELKMLAYQRKACLDIYSGNRNDAKPVDVLRAIKMDNELAEREAHLRNYGSLKPPKAIQQPVEAIAPLPPDNETEDRKTDNSVTNRNIQPDASLIIPVKKSPGKQYPTAVCAVKESVMPARTLGGGNRNNSPQNSHNKTLNLHNDIARI